MSAVAVDANSALVENLIGCGPYQFWHFVLFQWVTILQACNIAFMLFGKYLPPRLDCDSGCVPRNFVLESIFDYGQNNSQEIAQSWTKCENASVASTRMVQFYSVAVEWRLFCTQEKLPYLMLTTQMLGILIGSLVFGQLSDFYGRKKVLFIAILSQIACGAASSFSNGWQVFIVFRAFIGFFGGATHTTNQIYFAEVVNAENRLWLSNIGGWPLGMAAFGLIAWLTKDWRSLALYSNVACIPALFLLWRLDESPRWRLQHGYLREAEQTLRKFMRAQPKRKDSKKLNDELRQLSKIIALADGLNDDSSSNDSDDGRPGSPAGHAKMRYTYWHLLDSRAMRKYALVVAITHFSGSCIAHGIMFHADALSGNIYTNLLLLAMCRWVTNILTIMIDAFTRCGRKHIYISSATAIAICAIVIVTQGNDLAGSQLVTGLALSAGALASPLWISTLLWPAELFPTPVRNLAASFGAVFDRLGGVMIPQILLLAKLWPAAPYVVFASLALIASTAVAFILPETKGRPLPERMPSRNIENENAWEKYELVEDSSSPERTASPV